MIQAFKCTRANGTDFRTGTVKYEVGSVLSVDNPSPPGVGPCGVGLHVSPTALKTCRFGDQQIDRGKWRWFEVEIAESDVIAHDQEKFRVRSLRVVRELTRDEVLGADLADRVREVRADIETWKTIPWLNPSRRVTEDDLRPLLAAWHDAIAPWLRNGVQLPREARIVRSHKEATSAADADAATAAADADTADADTADADTAAAAAAAAADTAAAAAAAAATAAAAADTAAYYRLWPYWYRWYVRPNYLLWRKSRWKIAGCKGSNPGAPLVEILKLGCAPIGYSDGAFVVYAPDPVGGAE